ncbi:hypothetical protein GEMRC1_005049 [Eukaryota sp. GEM-RC1]
MSHSTSPTVETSPPEEQSSTQYIMNTDSINSLETIQSEIKMEFEALRSLKRTKGSSLIQIEKQHLELLHQLKQRWDSAFLEFTKLSMVDDSTLELDLLSPHLQNFLSLTHDFEDYHSLIKMIVLIFVTVSESADLIKQVNPSLLLSIVVRLFELLSRFISSIGIVAPCLIAIQRLYPSSSVNLANDFLPNLITCCTCREYPQSMTLVALSVLSLILPVNDGFSLDQLVGIKDFVFEIFSKFPTDSDLLLAALVTLSNVIGIVLSLSDNFDSEPASSGAEDVTYRSLTTLLDSSAQQFVEVYTLHQTQFLENFKFCIICCRIFSSLVQCSKVAASVLSTFLLVTLDYHYLNDSVLIETCHLISTSNEWGSILQEFLNHKGMKLLVHTLKVRLRYANITSPDAVEYNPMLQSISQMLRAVASFVSVSKSSESEKILNILSGVFTLTVPGNLGSLIRLVLELTKQSPSTVVAICHSIKSLISFNQSQLDDVMKVLGAKITNLINQFLIRDFSESLPLVNGSHYCVYFCISILKSNYPWKGVHINALINSLWFHLHYSSPHSIGVKLGITSVTKLCTNEFTREFITVDNRIPELIKVVLNGDFCFSIVDAAASCALALSLVARSDDSTLRLLLDHHDIMSSFINLMTKFPQSLTLSRAFLGILEVWCEKADHDDVINVITPIYFQTLNHIMINRPDNVNVIELAASCLHLLIDIQPTDFLYTIDDVLLLCSESLLKAINEWVGHSQLLYHSLAVFSFITSTRTGFNEAFKSLFDAIMDTICNILAYRTELGQPISPSICIPLFTTIIHISLDSELLLKMIRTRIFSLVQAILSYYSVDSVPCLWSVTLEEHRTKVLAEKAERRAKLLQKIKIEKEREEMIKVSASSKTAKYRAFQRKQFKQKLLESARKDDDVLKAVEAHMKSLTVIDDVDDVLNRNDLEKLEIFKILGRQVLGTLLLPTRIDSKFVDYYAILENYSIDLVLDLFSQASEQFTSSLFSNIDGDFISSLISACVFCCLTSVSSENQASITKEMFHQLLSLQSTLMELIGFQKNQEEDDEDDVALSQSKTAIHPILYTLVASMTAAIYLITLLPEMPQEMLADELVYGAQISQEVNRLRDQLIEKGKYPPLYVLQSMARKQLGFAAETSSTNFSTILSNIEFFNNDRPTISLVLLVLERLSMYKDIVDVLPYDLTASSLVLFMNSFKSRPFLISLTCDFGLLISTNDGHVEHLLVNRIVSVLRGVFKRYLSSNSLNSSTSPTIIHFFFCLVRFIAQLSIFPSSLIHVNTLVPYLLRLLNVSEFESVNLFICRIFSQLISKESIAKSIGNTKALLVFQKAIEKHDTCVEFVDVCQIIISKLSTYYIHETLSPLKKAIVSLHKRQTLRDVRTRHGVEHGALSSSESEALPRSDSSGGSSVDEVSENDDSSSESSEDVVAVDGNLEAIEQDTRKDSDSELEENAEQSESDSDSVDSIKNDFQTIVSDSDLDVDVEL